LPDRSTATFPIDAFARSCLLNGVDELGYIQGFAERIAAYERQHGLASQVP
jgi:3-isopropylmalate/(R)-2-methylmalate dehydratase small subunit